MAEVTWSDEASARLELIKAYIEQFDPAAAQRLARRPVKSTRRLEAFPNSGRPTTSGRRELVTVRPYILIYRVEGDEVLVLGIRHAAQLPEPD